MHWLWLAIGGALGTLARYGVNGWISGHPGKHYALAAGFPLGTLVVNTTGCYLIGVLAALTGPSLGRVWLRPEWRDFWMIGFCGGYTTFSSYGLQTLNLARDGEWVWVATNIIVSNVAGLFAVYLGWVTGRFIQARLHGGMP